jgi:hypothetical protein
MEVGQGPNWGCSVKEKKIKEVRGRGRGDKHATV